MMKITYRNQQNKQDPLHGAAIDSSIELAELLDQARTKRPFFARFSCDNGFELMAGIGADVACVQHSSSDRFDRETPNLMAVSRHPRMKRGYVEFLTANTPTPVAARYIISFDELTEVVLCFLQTGERSDAVVWQRLNLHALWEDAEGPAAQ
jgi:hypothetical protein